ncbi:hypothetical protein F4553_000670 [Allocatelliglobosispora scoriae]|uniref:Uncharacterized protein n=1 Tax=Allocatelliglobosispora scoriae TaxID=643052 RepID=A0A841BK83_9ACTN|nr:hypothetical protein [Allocatelliglobosispora scoriae]MBB5867291.1 hypothetical protein [Allocatelliglobosispora scoriae]
MTELHVSLDSSQLNSTERKLQEPLEEQLTSALSQAATRVAEAYDGQSEDEVMSWILREAQDGLHPDIAEGWQPDVAKLREVAQAVIRGEQFD